MLVPPPGAKVAIVEWEDLECPACAHAFPFVHMAVDHYKIPLVRYDFLIPGHIWSREAAMYARYLQDKVSPELATQYRREVFASQFKIASKDDLNRFTQEFFKKNGKQLPFVSRSNGRAGAQVKKDVALGNKLGLTETPTLVVVTPKGWIQVKDVSDLYQAIDQAEASDGDLFGGASQDDEVIADFVREGRPLLRAAFLMRRVYSTDVRLLKLARRLRQGRRRD
jgi:protein-disulfide isomerase